MRMELVEKYRTPAECYVYRNLSKNLHSSGVLCVMPTYRSAGAEASVCPAAIDILLRWSKEVFCMVLGLNVVALNRCDEPISYMELTFEKNCPNFSKVEIRVFISKIVAPAFTALCADFPFLYFMVSRLFSQGFYLGKICLIPINSGINKCFGQCFVR